MPAAARVPRPAQGAATLAAAPGPSRRPGPPAREPRRAAAPTLPAFAVRARGAVLWDADERSYIDFGNGSGTVLLGHADADVAAALAADPGEEIEAEVADRLRACAPCAEAIRFARSAEEAVAAAMQAARTHSGRPLVVVADGQDLGALAAQLEASAGSVAAIRLDPMRVGPAPGYVAAVRRLADAHGAVLVFDETVSGLRIDTAGAQGLYGVTPDLAVYGESLANGLPLAAVAGAKPLVEAIAPLPAVSTLSLAAAAAVLAKLEREPVIPTLRIRGAELQAEMEALLAVDGRDRVAAVGGDPTWSVLTFSPPEGLKADDLARLFRREALERGVHAPDGHCMSYAHGDDEITTVLAAYREVLPLVVEAARRGDIEARLRRTASPARPAR